MWYHFLNKQLSLIGCGIKTIAHLTKEAESYIKKAEKVLYLVNEPIMEEWIQVHAKKSKNLDYIYFSQKNRSDSYQQITQEILMALECYNFVCVAFYGHPTVFARPGLDAIIKAKNNGVGTVILPAISAEDCLFADLKIDPGDCGCYSVEATDMLLYQRCPEVSSHLIIWQIGLLGNLGHDMGIKKEALLLLKKYLLKFYSKNHRAILYEASFYPGIDCSIKEFLLDKLEEQNISKIATLYIFPGKKNEVNCSLVKKLGLS